MHNGMDKTVSKSMKSKDNSLQRVVPIGISTKTVGTKKVVKSSPLAISRFVSLQIQFGMLANVFIMKSLANLVAISNSSIN